MRVFVAIDLPDDNRDELETLQSALSVGRLSPPENLHLTLCFLGEQSDEAVEEAHHALSSVNQPGFDLQLSGVGTFGGASPQVVFAEVAASAHLTDLQRSVTRSLRRAGLDFQKQRFRPHFTIARLPRRPAPFEIDRLRAFLTDHAGFRGSRFGVAGFGLFSSRLSPDGAIHEVLASYP